MTYSTSPPQPVISGVPYPVMEVNGAPVTSLAEFVGTVAFRIDNYGSPYVIGGEGRERDGGVRVHEKNGRGGKDVRVWRVYVGPDGEYLAETAQ
jgi:hypothetical protein